MASISASHVFVDRGLYSWNSTLRMRPISAKERRRGKKFSIASDAIGDRRVIRSFYNWVLGVMNVRLSNFAHGLMSFALARLIVLE